MSATTLSQPETLAQRWEALRQAEPRLRVREAARRLDASEGALVGSQPGAIRLRPDWKALLEGLAQVGEVMALTRNETVVHERHGTYAGVSAGGHVGIVLGPDIDLRLFFSHWCHAWFVPAGLPGSPSGSIQVFDAAGGAVHKVFSTAATPDGALQALALRLADDASLPEFAPEPPRKADKDDAEIDTLALRQGWAGLKDTHDFFPLLRRTGAGRRQALRLAGPEWARPLKADAPCEALRQAAERGTSIMVFVGNPGCIQIHTGPVHRIELLGPWFNVLDPHFNLHLDTRGVSDAWLVTKPTRDGDVTSIEAFDAVGDVVMMVFGARKPGQPEDLGWRELAWNAAKE